MTSPKGFAGVRTVTFPLAIFWWGVGMVFAATVVLLGGFGLGVYFGIVLANRPDVPLQAPERASTVTHPKEIKP